MLSLCDGCQCFFGNNLTVVSAKEWKGSLCNIPTAQSYACKKLDCMYNVEGSCIEYQFCGQCLSSQEVIDRTFQKFASFA